MVVSMGLLFLITMFGLSTIRWSVDELKIAANQKGTIQARYIAETGVALMLQWFQKPGSFPEIGLFPEGYPEEGRDVFLSRREITAYDAPVFFDSIGESQYKGSADEPDFIYESETANPELVGDSVSRIGRLSNLKIYGPTAAEAFSTVEATGTTHGGMSHAVRVGMAQSPLPPVVAAIQIGLEGSRETPILVHWGNIRVRGNADLGDLLEAVPRKNPNSPVNGRPYSLVDRQDPWIDIVVGNSIINPSTSACEGCTEPFLSDGYDNLHQLLSGTDTDFDLDRWDYERLKSFAKHWGVYFASDSEGKLYRYRDGAIDWGNQMEPLEALTSEIDPDNRPFIFIDTVDQNPPDQTNLATLEVPIDYLKGIVIAEAHVILRENGPGRRIRVRSPSPEGDEYGLNRQDVVLFNIHFDGILSVAGRLTIEGQPKIFGALIARQGFSGSGQPEVWYDADLATGYYPGLPTVIPLKGSWYIP